MSKTSAKHPAPLGANESDLLARLAVHLITAAERRRFDRLLRDQHYLHNPTLIGAVLRSVVEADGQWLALLTFSSAAFHLKPRDRWLHWSPQLVAQRRHLIAQNPRFLILLPPGHCPNLASRALKLVAERPKHFGHPILALETFIDPQGVRGEPMRRGAHRAKAEIQDEPSLKAGAAADRSGRLRHRPCRHRIAPNRSR